VSAPSPLLDFFKRGEVARDVRLLAAQGILAPRAHEQLGILIILLEDADPEIRATADATLARIPDESLKAFLARSDVPIGIREFFADRGVFPAEIPAIEADEPLIDVEPPAEEERAEETAANDGNGAAVEQATAVEQGGSDGERASDERPDGVVQQIAQMGFSERLRAAVKGSREMRAILIRDPNKMISAAVMSSPKLTEQEVEGFARMANVGEDVLRIIGGNRAWLKNYGIVVGLTKNPKTPVAMSLNLMARLNARDLQMLSIDRNVPEPLRIAARKKVVQNTNR